MSTSTKGAPAHAGAPTKEPFYKPFGREIEIFEAAYRSKMAVLLKGPTGCGKTRFVSHMAWRLGLPVHTVACHDDLTSSDLVGRYLIKGRETVWLDGPLDQRGAHRRHLLPRRGSRSEKRHDSHPPPAL